MVQSISISNPEVRNSLLNSSSALASYLGIDRKKNILYNILPLGKNGIQFNRIHIAGEPVKDSEFLPVGFD